MSDDNDPGITDFGMPESAPLDEAQEAAKMLAEQLDSSMPTGWGYVLLLLQMGGGDATYISSVEREGAARSLIELAEHLLEGPRPVRVLICEDQAKAIGKMRSAVRAGSRKAAIQVVSTYEHAEAAIGGRVDVILIDGQLNGPRYRDIGHGLELVRRRREYEARFELPRATIVGVSSDHEINEMMVQQGANATATKPFDLKKVAEIVREFQEFLDKGEVPDDVS